MRSPRNQRSFGRSTFSPRAWFAVLALTTSLLAGIASPALAAPSTATQVAPVDRVVVVLAPFLTWEDVRAPASSPLRAAAADGAVGNMNSITGDVGWPTVAGGALTISASRWTAGPVGTPADPKRLPAIRLANAGSLDAPFIGALGAALRGAGRTTAAVGNSDEDTATPAGTRRPAALAAMDPTGRVDLSLTSRGLLVSDASAPFGVRADPRQMQIAMRVALAEHPSLVVIDAGDLERAHDAPNQTPQQAAASHAKAVQSLNGLVSDVRSVLAGSRTLLVIAAPATDKPYYQPPYFGPAILVGPGFGGQLTSAGTQRPGLVTSIDIAPTALAALGVAPSSQMVGQAMTGSTGASATAGRASEVAVLATIGQLDRLGTSVGAIDYLRDLYFIRYFAWATAYIALFAAAVALFPALRRAAHVSRILVLLALSVPAGAWLMFWFDRYPTTGQAAALAWAVATIFVFGVVLGLTTAFKSRAEVPVLALSVFTSLLILADQWTGHPFETGLFSYSIRAGWRYYGMGNEGAALVVGASILAVGLTCDLLADGRWGRPARIGLMPLVGIVAILTAAAPFAGANAGVAVWGVVAYGIAWARVNGARLTWKTAGALVVAIVAVVAALVAIDMLRGGGETHLGRFFSELASGNFTAVSELVRRKVSNNLGYLPQTPYTWLAIALAASLGAAQWVGSCPLARTLRTKPGMAAGLLGVVIGGAVALVTEDSGIVMPALMLLAGGLPALYVMVAELLPTRSSATPLSDSE